MKKLLRRLLYTYELLKNKINFLKGTEAVSFNTSSISKGHHNVTYKNVKAIKCPFDYVMYQMIIQEVKPDLIIEVGTNIGGGALYLADLLETAGHGMLHTIDIVDQSDAQLKNHNRIKLFTQGWESYDLNEAKGYNTILVIEDASHTYECTIGVINKFAHLVSVGSYLIIEDGIVDKLGLSKHYNGGPLKAIREFMHNNTEFIIDRKWCDFFGKNATFNVNGYLKRVK